MDALYDTLARRMRPEDVAEEILSSLGTRLNGSERAMLERAAEGSLVRRFFGFTSMSQDWGRAVGPQGAMEVAADLFASAPVVRPGDADVPERVDAFLDVVELEIRKIRGRSDFLADRLNREARRATGLSLSHRKYNRMFRLLRRIEQRSSVLRHEVRKRHMEKLAKVGFVHNVSRERFVASPVAGAFVAYLTAKKAKRSVFTAFGQERPFDQIAEMLLARCRAEPATDWWVVAHAWPTIEVLGKLTESERVELLTAAHETLHEAADLLRLTYEKHPFDRSSMVVRRGDDSTTWNQLAGAFNAARTTWVALAHAMGVPQVLEAMCVPKAMRLIAGDVAAWHRGLGHVGDPNVKVAAALPAPWEVLDGVAECTAGDVRVVCSLVGIDPYETGWLAPHAPAAVAPFRPTPELVHGVAISHPRLAALLKSEGVFSGKPRKRTAMGSVLEWLGKVGRS